MDDLVAYDPKLANKLRSKPSEFLPILEEAATLVAKTEFSLSEEQKRNPVYLQTVQILLRSSANAIAIRQLNSSHVSHLVMVSGIVISASKTMAKATHLTIKCKNADCNHEMEITCSDGFGGANLPSRCKKEEETAGTLNAIKCGNNPYIIVGEKSRYCDHQVLKLQESPETIPT